tara:strand:- start:585 stop:752 length:168 start_codon:yes stop_codon:yes gene_type:complete
MHRLQTLQRIKQSKINRDSETLKEIPGGIASPAWSAAARALKLERFLLSQLSRKI